MDGYANITDIPLIAPELKKSRETARAELGPASGARTVFDRLACPLVAALGFQTAVESGDGERLVRAILSAGGTTAATLLVTPWGCDAGTAWRDSVRYGIGSLSRWCLCVTGPALRVFDARRTYSRRFIEFDLDAAPDDEAAFAIFWGLLRADAFTASDGALLDRAVSISEQHRSQVRDSLQRGVRDALVHLGRAFLSVRGHRGQPDQRPFFDDSLVVVYRVLFLLFAEARGLVPRWHPVYRDSYTIESLRRSVEKSARPRGLWESLQAIARLAHRGCHAGRLRVPPFNGRLFSPAHAPLADSVSLDDGAVRDALLALTTRGGKTGRERISYADLGVEHLGSVYERVLDLDPVVRGRELSLLPTGRRKATGSFYTPRALTECLTRRTLAPIVRDMAPERILSLRVLDPAMGSGAFLVAACRYLALAYESALVEHGGASASDITEADRAVFRRDIAQRCLFGVDINPMAVQLGRLSLWLATLASDRPLTFLDHHLRAGNSLVGAALADLARQPPPSSHRACRAAALPLFDWTAAEGALASSVGVRESISEDPGDTLDQVRTKERLLASVLFERAPLARWKSAADLWCAGWIHPDGDRRRSLSRAYGALLDEILGGAALLPPHLSSPILTEARATAGRQRFFHWTMEFPEVFYEEDGQPQENPGFDAILGNPPWETLRGERAGLSDTVGLTAFTRTSGVYALQGDGHANLYQVFLERALSLARRGGRIGFVVPSGLGSDHGCAALRHHLFDRCDIDTFLSIDNRRALFPIHRGLKFLLLAATRGGTTTRLRCRFGVQSSETLDRVPDRGDDPEAITIARGLVEQISGGQLAIPDLRTAADVDITSRIAFSIPPLGGMAGWHATFGRELNATDDRRHFVSGPCPGHCPVIEGKQVQPFRVDVAAARFYIAEQTAACLLRPNRPYDRPRLGYREVAAATNRLTLIAAIVPAGVVTTHTVFCMKQDVGEELRQFLCGMFNSFVANYLVRLRVGTHVTAAIVESLRVPRPDTASDAFREIASIADRLGRGAGDAVDRARLQALAAGIYGLDRVQFEHVLDTFPLIDLSDRHAAAEAFAAHGRTRPGVTTEGHGTTPN